ncbi:MAG: S8 family serine peptidase [Proteobacteria bacterium]|nr:S8 family serine peptidase [Pseudomonadota bacterium]
MIAVAVQSRVRSPRWAVGFSLLLLACLALACGGGDGGGSSSDDGGGGSSGLRVSGTLFAPSRTAADSDVNAQPTDPTAPPVPSTPNDTPATAQLIPNPVTVGGYVNVAGQGSAGRSQMAGDAADYYRVSLAAMQTVRLVFAGDGVTDDLDLQLLDLAQTPVDLSQSGTPVEEVVAPTAGDYYVLVTAFAGSANYVLIVGSTATSAGLVAPAAEPEPEFVPGEVLVRLRAAQTAAANARLMGERLESMGLDFVRGPAAGAGGPALVRLRDVDHAARAFAALGASAVRLGSAELEQRDPERQLALDTERLAKVLRRRADVECADLNYVRRAAFTPDDPLFDQQWDFEVMNLEDAWDVPRTGSPIVAVVDSGIVLSHPDLDGQLVPGYDFISSPARSRDGGGIDPDPSDPGDVPGPGASFHGTHVAGTVAAETNNGAGVAGVAFEARIMPLRVLGLNGQGTDFDIIEALRFAAGLSNSSGTLPAEAADVINMSLGGPGFSQSFQDAITAVRAAGVTVVAAAGNDSSSTSFYPAAYPGVISVSATARNDALASYSNFGPTIDIAAPGGDFLDGILSTWLDDDPDPGDPALTYVQLIGTSMAAPHVSGVIALMLGVNPGLGPQDFDNLLAAGLMTVDLGSPGRDDFFGYGRIDALAAVNAAAVTTPGTPPPALDPRLEANPLVLSFGVDLDAIDVTVVNAGGGSLMVNAPPGVVTDDGDAWLSVVPVSVGADNTGTYRAQIDRTAVPGDGLYTGSITFSTVAANTVVLPVIMQVGASLSSTGDAGYHFVTLVNPATSGVVYEVGVAVSNGTYSFEFTDVSPGSYFLVAGTDADNDGFLCDAGEACGVYPTRAAPIVINVSGNRSGLDFVTDLNGAFVSSASASGAESGFSRSRGGRRLQQ